MNLKLLRAQARALRRASLRVMHHSLSLIGLVAVAVAGWTALHPQALKDVASRFVPTSAAPAPRLDPFPGAIGEATGEASRLLGLAAASETLDEPVLMRASANAATAKTPTARDKRALTKYLAKKYRVNVDAIAMLVDAAYVTGKDTGLDPVLLLSVMAIESGFNPFAESTAGASGLMQVMVKVHDDKLSDFGGENIALNPVANLRVGAIVLKDCIARGGSVADGLRLYVGAGTGSDNGYGARVLSEKDRMLAAIRGLARVRIEPIPTKVKPPKVEEDKPVDEKADLDRVAALS